MMACQEFKMIRNLNLTKRSYLPNSTIQRTVEGPFGQRWIIHAHVQYLLFSFKDEATALESTFTDFM